VLSDRASRRHHPAPSIKPAIAVLLSLPGIQRAKRLHENV
jgi:hypothetical protein